MSSEVTIRASELGKAYLVYRNPFDRLKQMFFRKRAFYREYWALQNVSFEMRRGETVGIIGRNGAGKSTLLQLICGTVGPTTGKIAVDGRVAALLELGAGFNPEFTGRENVLLAGTVLGLSREQILERMESILEFASIGDFVDQPVKVYSSGMYARLAFALAAHVDADILIVDEILAVGDASFTQKCMRFIHRFRENGTLLFVSHDTSSVLSLCDRVLWLDRGQLRMEGEAREVCEAYALALRSEDDNGAGLKFGGRRAQLADRPQGADHRIDLLKSSNLRNEVEVFDFNPQTSWHGTRGATIETVHLLNPEHQPIGSVTGGEEIILKIVVRVDQELSKPIIGFHVSNKLGQVVFGDNTFLSFKDENMLVGANTRLTGTFRFQMPYLPTGDYGVTVAIANGTQIDHVQQHWLDDALFFRVISSHVIRGLCGIPMLGIALEREPLAATDGTSTSELAAAPGRTSAVG